MNRVKHKVHGRQLIHAYVKKIQPALTSLVGSQSRQASLFISGLPMTREWPLVLDKCLSRARRRSWDLLHPQPKIRQPQVPWTAAVPTKQSRKPAVTLHHTGPSQSHPLPQRKAPHPHSTPLCHLTITTCSREILWLGEVSPYCETLILTRLLTNEGYSVMRDMRKWGSVWLCSTTLQHGQTDPH